MEGVGMYRARRELKSWASTHLIWQGRGISNEKDVRSRCCMADGIFESECLNWADGQRNFVYRGLSAAWVNAGSRSAFKKKMLVCVKPTFYTSLMWKAALCRQIYSFPFVKIIMQNLYLGFLKCISYHAIFVVFTPSKRKFLFTREISSTLPRKFSLIYTPI